MKRKTLYEWCVENDRMDLIEEWDMDENRGVQPWSVTYGSNMTLSWVCEKGHRWNTSPHQRTSGHNCPVCAGHRIDPGVNDLATTHPEIAAQWHPKKNGDLTPSMVVPGSHDHVWWRCKNGHEWRARVGYRTEYDKCPYCNARFAIPGYNDLATLRPDLMDEWNVAKNVDNSPYVLKPSSHKRVWWRCKNGHEYQMQVYFRNGGSQCPICAEGAASVPILSEASQRKRRSV